MSYSLNKLVTERKTRPLPSASAMELAEEVERNGQGIQGRVLAKVVKELDILTKMVEEDRQITTQIYEKIYEKLEDIEDQLPTTFLKKIWFPVTLAVIIAVVLVWLGLK